MVDLFLSEMSGEQFQPPLMEPKVFLVVLAEEYRYMWVIFMALLSMNVMSSRHLNSYLSQFSFAADKLKANGVLLTIVWLNFELKTVYYLCGLL